MRKFIASTTIAASFLGGGIAGATLTPDAAGAEEPRTQVNASRSKDKLSKVLDGLVSNRTLTKAQADAVESALIQAREDRPINHRHPHRGTHPFLRAQILADLGIEPQVLRSGLEKGLTLSEIAETNGSSADALAEALTQAMNDRLDSAVESGKIDRDTAAQRAEKIEERVDNIINETFEDRNGQNRHNVTFTDTKDSV